MQPACYGYCVGMQKNITPPEARLEIHKHLTETLTLIMFEDETDAPTTEDKQDAEDLATVILEALGLEVVSVAPDGAIGCSISLS